MPVTHARTYNLVLDWLEEQLRKGAITVGDKLPGERALAEQFEISRSSVREAIKVADAMGLVRSSTGSGPNAGAIVVAEPSSALKWALRMHVYTKALPMGDIVATRVVIESQAASAAALTQNSPDRDAAIEKADALIEMMDDPALPSEEYHSLDTEFHILITSMAGNLVVDTIMESLREATMSYVREAIAERNDWGEIRLHLQQQHRRILEAVRNRQPAEAADAVREHIHWFYSVAGGAMYE